MNEPNVFHEKTEWIIVGPMGPSLPKHFAQLPILAVDGGLNHVERFDFWVGDGDSADTPLEHQNLIKLSSDKDKSDLACSLELLKLPKQYRLHLWGFTGGRIDHEILVMGECHQFLKSHPESRIAFYGNRGIVSYEAFSAGEWRLSHDGLFSLVVMEESSISINGHVKFPVSLAKNFAPLSSLGLSNRASGEFSIKSTTPFTLFYPEKT